MAFPTNIARAMAPAALIAVVAAPVSAQTSPEIKQVEAHLAASQSMTAHFTQTDSKNRTLGGNLQLKRPGRIWQASGPLYC